MPEPAIPLERPVAFMDIESTGLSTANDRIVELAVLIVTPDGGVSERVRRFNPEMEIPKGASDVHGITNADVKDEPPFRRRARALADLLEPCDLAGFNIRRFDLPLLLAEFRRSGVPFDPKARSIVDIQMIFHREEPRDLTAAARFYLGSDFEDAHSALADIRASADVFWAQLGRYPHVPHTIEGLHRYCDEVSPFRTEFDRWFRGEADGLVFMRGKHKGRALADVASEAPDYLAWMLGADDMDPDVLTAVREALAAMAPEPLEPPGPMG